MLGLSHGVGLRRFDTRHRIPRDRLQLLLAMGPDKEYNPAANWWDRAENLLLWSEDLTEWNEAGGTIVTATTAEDDSAVAMPFLYQAASAPNATTWTWTVWVLKDAVVPATRFPRFRINVAATYVVHLDTSSGATTESVALGGSHTVVSDGSYWKLSLTFTTDDGNGISVRIYPAIGANADLTTVGNAAVGEITVAKQQLTPGTSLGTYCKTEARQRVWDWSGNARHAVVGPTGGIETNDPGDSIWRKNLLAYGSAEDLTEWSQSNTPVVTPTTLEDDGATYEAVFQAVSSPTARTHTWTLLILQDDVGADTRFPAFHCLVADNYRVRLDTSTGATAENSALSGSHTVVSETIDSTDYWRLSISFTTDDAAGISLEIYPARGANADLTTPSATAVGEITVLRQQLEVGSSATGYSNADRQIVAARGDFDGTDDYCDVASLPLDADWTFVAVIRPEDNTSRGLFRNGVAAPNISLDANGKVSYAGGATVAGTNAVVQAEWHTIGITKKGTTITHFLDGAANGSGTSGSANAFTALRIGYDGSAFYKGMSPLFSAHSRDLAPREMRDYHELIRLWWNLDERGKRNLTLP